ncbi:MAG TPA: hypothetical protein VI756_09525 [Blastocatellia bacterium]
MARAHDNDGPGAGEADSARLDAEWAALSAIREMLGIALKGEVSPTYDQSLRVAKVIAPAVFDSPGTLLGSEKVDERVEVFRQRARAMSSLEGRHVTPVEVVDEDITAYKKMTEADQDLDLIAKRLRDLEVIRTKLAPKSFSENKLLLRDIFHAHRNLPVSGNGEGCQQYKLSKHRALRLRLLHPDLQEHLTGADLVYEIYWEKKSRVRVAFVQYKIWDGTTLYSSHARNLVGQISRLKGTACDSGLCAGHEQDHKRRPYRLPFCSAFIRPTDRLQDPDARMISSGLHVPVCVVGSAWQDTGLGGKKITKSWIRGQSPSHKVFEEMFNIGMLGSRWLTYPEIEELYQRSGILEAGERIVLHAQEFGVR